MAKPLSAPSLTQLDALVAAGLVDEAAAPALRAIVARYPVSVTPVMAARIRTPEDPIGRQFLPRLEEAIEAPEERADPIGDFAHSPVKGLVHRYPDRVLLKVLHACPVYCRFCFRREMVGPSGDGVLSEAELNEAFAYIAARPEIFEVILTGGDPLMLSPRRLAAIGARLGQIAHVRLVRWHSRVPVVAPERLNPALIRALNVPGKANYGAIHANHVDEFTPPARVAIAALLDAGITLLGQSVLLRGVNASSADLIALFREMAANRIVPLYLHHPDLAPGTGHFRLSVREGQAIYAELRGRLSGQAIPHYVLDLPGGFGKVSLGESALVVKGGRQFLRDAQGALHPYPPQDQIPPD